MATSEAMALQRPQRGNNGNSRCFQAVGEIVCGDAAWRCRQECDTAHLKDGWPMVAGHAVMLTTSGAISAPTANSQSAAQAKC